MAGFFVSLDDERVHERPCAKIEYYLRASSDPTLMTIMVGMAKTNDAI